MFQCPLNSKRLRSRYKRSIFSLSLLGFINRPLTIQHNLLNAPNLSHLLLDPHFIIRAICSCSSIFTSITFRSFKFTFEEVIINLKDERINRERKNYESI